MSIVTRFAPSPTGHLHLGHAFSARIAWHAARAARGRFLLRLEDIDPARCRPAFAEGVLQDLAWLGLDWDGDVRTQSAHLQDYAAVLADLAGRGLIYPCFCTRADILASAGAPHGPSDGVEVTYPGTCRHLPPPERAARIAAGVPYAQRLDMARALHEVGPLSYQEQGQGCVVCDPARFGDIVLARKDAPASYHLCATHDDARQGVTLVTRGVDLQPLTDIQRVLQALMGWPEPAYLHHRLLLDASGRRFAKRDRALTLLALRESGRSPAEVWSMIDG